MKLCFKILEKEKEGGKLGPIEKQLGKDTRAKLSAKIKCATETISINSKPTQRKFVGKEGSSTKQQKQNNHRPSILEAKNPRQLNWGSAMDDGHVLKLRCKMFQ